MNKSLVLLSLLCFYVARINCGNNSTNNSEETKPSKFFKINPVTSDDLAIRRLHFKTTKLINSLWNSLNDPDKYESLEKSGPISKTILLVISKLRADIFALDNKLQDFNLEFVLKSLAYESPESGQTLRWRLEWEKLSKIVGKVNLLYSYLDDYMIRSHGDIFEDALLEFAQSLTQLKYVETSLENALNELHMIIASESSIKRSGLGSSKNILGHLAETIAYESDRFICDVQQSHQQIVYNFYNYLSLAQSKGYVMIFFSYMMLKVHKLGDFKTEVELTRKAFESQSLDQLKQARQVMSALSTEIMRCDSKIKKENKNYIRMTNLLQGFIQNEVDMDSSGQCKLACSDFKVASTDTCYNGENGQFCSRQRACKGKIFDCEFYNKDSWVCLSEDPIRRYDWIEYEDNTILGNKGACKNIKKVDSWWRWLYHCTYCLCKCDEPGPNSDRYWSLLPAVSNVSANKIVTGLRFVKRNRVISIEIEEATSLPEGLVDEETKSWKKTPVIDINDELKNNIEYVVMSYYSRSIDLDNLVAPVGHVITGIKFRTIGGHLNLEAQATPIDFTTGELLQNRSIWIGNDNTPVSEIPRIKLSLESPDVPTLYNGTSRITSTDNSYIDFDTTCAFKDVRQTTVPYIDSQEVLPISRTWLSGIGLHHKGSHGYGGFIGISISTYNFTRHLVSKKEDLKNNNLRYRVASNS